MTTPEIAAVALVGVLVIGGLAWVAARRAPICSCNRPDCGGGCSPLRDEAILPSCFGSFPGWQQQAENHCCTCPAERLCLGREPNWERLGFGNRYEAEGRN